VAEAATKTAATKTIEIQLARLVVTIEGQTSLIVNRFGGTRPQVD